MLATSLLVTGCGNNFGAGSKTTINIFNGSTPAVNLSATSGFITNEGGGTAALTAVLNVAPTADVTVDFTTGDSTEILLRGGSSPAVAASAITLTFTAANWSTPQTITLVGQDDLLTDGNIAVTITASATTSTDLTYNGLSVSNLSASNSDNDTAGFTLSATSGLSTTEAGGTDTFTVVLNTLPTASVTLLITAADTTEAQVQGGDSPGTPATSITLTFTTANWSTPQTVTVIGQNDALDDGDILSTLTTGAASSTDPAYNGLAVSDVTVSNTDNDTAGVTLSGTSGFTTTEAGGTDNFTVVLNAQPSANVTIDLTTGDATEVMLQGGDSPVTPDTAITLTFTTANWSTPQTVTLIGQDDLVDDGDVGVTITTANAVSTDTAYSGLVISDITASNTDDEATLTPGITLSATSGFTTTEAGTTASFTVVLDSTPSANVTIGISSGDTSEILLRGGDSPGASVASITLTFTSANWSTPQTVTMYGQDDALSDGNIITTVTTAAAVSTDTNYSGMNAANVSVTNSDNDTIGVTVSPTSGLVTTEGAGTAQFTVVLNTAPDGDVVILVVSGDTGEITTSSGSLTFTTANWSTPQTVTLTGVNDVSVDGGQAVTVSLITDGILTADTTGYAAYNPADVSATNADDDSTGFSVIPSSGLTTSESGDSDSFSVSLSTPPDGNVVVNVTSADTTEATVNKATLTFTTANWASPQTVVVTGVNDALTDGNQNVSILLAVNVGSTTDTTGYAVLDPVDPTLVNSDDDQAGTTVTPTSGLTTTEAGQTTTFSVRLNTVPDGDVVLALSSPDTGEVTIDKASLTFNASNWATPQVVTCTGVNDALTDGSQPIVIAVTINGGSTTDTTGYAATDPADPTVTNLDNEAEAEGTTGDPVNLVGVLPYDGSVGTGYSYYKVTGLAASASHFVSISNLSANLTLAVYGAGDFATALCTSAKFTDSRPESCFATSNASGELYIRVDGTSSGTGSEFIIDAIPAPSDQGTSGSPFDLTGLVPYADGVVGAGSSYYIMTGLTPSATRLVSATNLTDDVDLFIYSDSGFSTLLCQSNTSTIAESCQPTVPASGNLYIKVTNRNATAGATYTMRVQAPAAGEGTSVAPIDLTGLLPYDGQMTDPPQSFYVVGGLIPSLTYRVMAYNVTNGSTALFVYSDSTFTTQLCTQDGAVNLPESCNAAANGSGKLYIKIMKGTSAYTKGGTFNIDLK